MQRKERKNEANLIFLIESGQWKDVAKRLSSTDNKKFYEGLLLKQDHMGRLPIHKACLHNRKVGKQYFHALKSLVDCHEDSWGHGDEEECTPMHLLFYSKGVKSIGIAVKLAQSSQDKFPDLFSKSDKYGRTPLFHLVHNKLCSLEDLKFPTFQIMPALEKMFEQHSSAVRALTIPCDADKSFQSSPTHGPSHTFPNIWRKPSGERTPLHMMWCHAIDSNHDHKGRVKKEYKAKIQMALLFLRCAYLHEVNGTLEFGSKRKRRQLYRQILSAVRSKAKKDTDNIQVALNIHRRALNEVSKTSLISDIDWQGEEESSRRLVPEESSRRVVSEESTEQCSPTITVEERPSRPDASEVKDKQTRTNYRIIHATVRFHQYLPCERMLHMFLKQRPEQLLKPEARSGYIPLHLAIVKNAPLTIIRRLIECNKESVKVKTKDNQLPLHLALAHKCSSEVTEFLLKAHPEAIQKPDPITDLYPFMMAAHFNRPDDNETVATIFKWLIMEPSVVNYVLTLD